MTDEMAALSPEKALIFRITHITNMTWILANGLHCRNSPMQDPNHVDIGNPDLIDKRKHRVVPVLPGGTLSDYVPFYFTPYSPMLYNIKTGWGGIAKRPLSEIVILVSSLPKLKDNGIQFVFTDRHAYPIYAKYSNDLADLGGLAWTSWNARDFKRDPNDPAKFERYQAEALAFQHVPVNALQGIVCNGADHQVSLAEMVNNSGAALTVQSLPAWYL